MQSLRRFILGTRWDWHLRMPSVPRFHPGLHWAGPLAVLGSCIASWPAFAGASGDGNVAFGLWVGAASILLMAWSFILALRPTLLEPFFGGLDSMYRIHRWAGSLAVAFMFLHTSIEPEIEGGIRGAARSVADQAEDLAGAGEILLYVLIGLSLARLFPYRIWRWTHKLLGVPFIFASWHFFTAEKPYANGSGWGWWFGFWMVVGIATYLARVVGVDMIQKGKPYRIVAADHIGSTTRLELEPARRALGQRAGQFAFLKLDVPGMREPHPFTIASAPERENLEFYIRHLGDWSSKLPDCDLVGKTARVEGPFGEFAPLGRPNQLPVWIAGGVGITPFLAALDRPASNNVTTPVLMYAVRSTEDNPIVDRLREAEADGRVELQLYTSTTGRLTEAALDERFPNGMAGCHVALCGPSGLVRSMASAAYSRGAATVETEDFDIRQGFGPERSKEISELVPKLSQIPRGHSASAKSEVGSDY